MTTTAADSDTIAEQPPARPSYAPGRAVRTGAVAGAAAAAVNVVISAVARGPFEASDDFAPLTPGPIILRTIIGAASRSMPPA